MERSEGTTIESEASQILDTWTQRDIDPLCELTNCTACARRMDCEVSDWAFESASKKAMSSKSLQTMYYIDKASVTLQGLSRPNA